MQSNGDNVLIRHDSVDVVNNVRTYVTTERENGLNIGTDGMRWSNNLKRVCLNKKIRSKKKK